MNGELNHVLANDGDLRDLVRLFARLEIAALRSSWSARQNRLRKALEPSLSPVRTLTGCGHFRRRSSPSAPPKLRFSLESCTKRWSHISESLAPKFVISSGKPTHKHIRL